MPAGTWGQSLCKFLSWAPQSASVSQTPSSSGWHTGNDILALQYIDFELTPSWRKADLCKAFFLLVARFSCHLTCNCIHENISECTKECIFWDVCLDTVTSKQSLGGLSTGSFILGGVLMNQAKLAFYWPHVSCREIWKTIVCHL